jgi:hypothetical protein
MHAQKSAQCMPKRVPNACPKEHAVRVRAGRAHACGCPPPAPCVRMCMPPCTNAYTLAHTPSGTHTAHALPTHARARWARRWRLPLRRASLSWRATWPRRPASRGSCVRQRLVIGLPGSFLAASRQLLGSFQAASRQLLGRRVGPLTAAACGRGQFSSAGWTQIQTDEQPCCSVNEV